MTNKEKLEQLTGDINSLNKLVEHIYEREIYPVSFFSQAFDITNKIQESLHQIEIAQIELFEKQMKEHQAQIRSIQSKEKKAEPAHAMHACEERQPAMPPLPDHPVHTSPETPTHGQEKKPESNEKKEVAAPSIEKIQQAPAPSLDKTFGKTTLSDLKKTLTINDRFRFCRGLFSSDEDLMNRTFHTLNKMESYDDSMTYIKAHFNWDTEDDVATEFISMIEKRFN